MEIQTPQDSGASDIKLIGRMAVKYLPLIILSTVLTTALALTYTLMAKPVYEAKVLIRIDKQDMGMNSLNSISLAGGQDFDYRQTQIKLFKSRSLIKETLLKLQKDKFPFTVLGVNSPEHLATIFLKKIEVKPVLRSQLVYLTVKDGDKFRAQKYANTLAENYIGEPKRRYITSLKGVTTWVTNSIAKQEISIRDQEAELEKFNADNAVSSLSKNIALSEALIATNETASIKIRLSMNDEMDETQKFAATEKLKDLNNKITAERNKIHAFKATQSKAKIKALKLSTLNQGFENLLKFSTQTLSAKDFNPQNISIVDKAETPQKQSSPRPTLNILIGIFTGLMLGCFIAFIIEYLDDSIKTPVDVESYLKIPFIGMIPKISLKHENSTPERIVVDQPKGTTAENYRAIRTNIIFGSAGQMQKLMITSASPGEGKSTTCVNLAQAMATSGEKVLIIDSDMRRPRQRKIFGYENNPAGLSNFLAGTSSLDEILCDTETPGLSLINAGPIPPNPVELLNSKRLQELVDIVSTRYDRILFDTPPIVSVTDSAIISRFVDGVILVVSCGSAHREAIKSGIEIFKKIGAHIIGCVLNKAKTGQSKYYYYQYQYEYSSVYNKDKDIHKNIDENIDKKEKKS